MFSDEIVKSKVLKWAVGAMVLNYFVIFHFWIKLSDTTVDAVGSLDYRCPPYWQNCDIFYVFQALPQGYSQSFFYMLLFGVLAWAVYLMSQQKWRETVYILIPLFFWHAFNVLFYTDYLSGNYEYYVLGFGLILFFFPHKEFFLKLMIVLFYSLSTVAKIHPAWIEGGYFNNLRTGLPFFPDWSIPIWTNLIILAEMVGAWFLMSGNSVRQRVAVSFFTLFHLYSGILVQYRYPSTVLPMLLILFGPWYKKSSIPLDRKSLIGWTLMVVLILLQFSPKLLPGDEKLTLEANKYGLYMFESNHQCVWEAKVFSSEENESKFKKYTGVSSSARARCSPYYAWFKYKQMCEQLPKGNRIALTFDHSINGGPFLRIVDEPNICNLEYKPFSHNTWIKTELDNPAVIGWPVKNVFN